MLKLLNMLRSVTHQHVIIEDYRGVLFGGYGMWLATDEVIAMKFGRCRHFSVSLFLYLLGDYLLELPRVECVLFNAR